MKRIFADYVYSALGVVGVFADDYGIFSIRMLSPGEEQNLKSCELTKRGKTELEEYFRGQRKQFEIPLRAPDKSPFFQKVYDALLQIPFGSVVSYKDIAVSVGSPLACRGVGNCVGRNPYMIVVPCHRVIRSSGQIGGFAFGTAIKQKLLSLEGIHLN